MQTTRTKFEIIIRVKIMMDELSQLQINRYHKDNRKLNKKQICMTYNMHTVYLLKHVVCLDTVAFDATQHEYVKQPCIASTFLTTLCNKGQLSNNRSFVSTIPHFPIICNHVRSYLTNRSPELS